MNKKASSLFLILISFVIILACSTGTAIETGKPTVALAAPLANSSHIVGQEVKVQAAVVDTEGISRVQLWVDGQLVNSQDVEPPLPSMTIRHSWTPDTLGNHIIEIKAYNTNNRVNEPVQVFITVIETTAIEPILPPTTAPTVIAQASASPTAPPETTVPEPTATPTTLATLPPVATPTPTDTPQYSSQRQPIIHSFTADRYTIKAGEKVTLSWQIENVRAYSLRYNGKVEEIPGNNSIEMLPLNTTVYELVVSSDTGTTTKSLTVTVLNSPEPDSTPAIEYFYAYPASFPVGSCTTLYWKVTGLTQEIKINYESVTASGDLIKCHDSDGDFVYSLQVFVGAGETLRKNIDINVWAPSVAIQETALIPLNGSLDVDQDGQADFRRDGQGIAATVQEGPAIDYPVSTLSTCRQQIYHPDVPMGPYPGEGNCFLTSQNRVGKFKIREIDSTGVMSLEYIVWNYVYEGNEPCINEPRGIFQNIWTKYKTLLGCPHQTEPIGGFWAEQPFQNGHMFWSKEAQLYLVTIGDNSGAWQLFPEDDSIWKEGMPQLSCDIQIPSGFVQPVRGFGSIWCTHSNIREAIGWGIDAERGFEGGVDLIQGFERGIIFRDSDGQTGGWVYMLFNDGSFSKEIY